MEAEFERLLAEANELFCRVGKDRGRHMVAFMVAFMVALSGFLVHPLALEVRSS